MAGIVVMQKDLASRIEENYGCEVLQKYYTGWCHLFFVSSVTPGEHHIAFSHV